MDRGNHVVCDGYWMGELLKFCRPHIVKNGADRTKAVPEFFFRYLIITRNSIT